MQPDEHPAVVLAIQILRSIADDSGLRPSHRVAARRQLALLREAAQAVTVTERMTALGRAAEAATARLIEDHEVVGRALVEDAQRRVATSRR